MGNGKNELEPEKMVKYRLTIMRKVRKFRTLISFLLCSSRYLSFLQQGILYIGESLFRADIYLLLSSKSFSIKVEQSDAPLASRGL